MLEQSILKDIPILFLLVYLSVVDLKKREVPHLGVLALFLYSLPVLGLKVILANVPMALGIFGVLIFIALVTSEGFGGGDIKLITALALYLGDDLFLLALPMVVLLVGTLIWAIATRKGWRYPVPFVPYIFLSYLAYMGVKVWGMSLVCL